ncbi:TPA: putative baseplate assembly protein [Methanosarcinaceae archaeon]|nr:putative baseplate assembly protein [Methanosarcinaceae archaeon]
MCYLYEKDLIKPGKHGDEPEYEWENAKLKWEISLSPDGKQWKEVFSEDGTKNFRKSGRLLFTGLEAWARSSIGAWPSGKGAKEEKYFWLRCTLLESEYEYPPRIEKISLNTTAAAQKKKVKDGMLEKSSGLPDQVFKLPKTPVLRESLKLTVAGEEWEEVEDFDGSGPESPHFTLDSLKGEIRFGDGLRGRVPREAAEIRALEYETGRGKQGNLPAGSRWAVKGGKTEGLAISNLKPATCGKEEEDIAESVDRFVRDLKVPYRAVTFEDFEYIARETPGLRVAQAKAVPNYDPADPEGGEGSVTVVVIPFSPLETFDIPPGPSGGFVAAVARHLEKHRLLGTRVHVVSPEYVKVEVKATVGLSRGFSGEENRQAVLANLKLFLHPAKGGSDGKGWPVGKPVYRSELYRLIMGTEGVDSVEKISIHAGKGAEQDENGDLVLALRTATVYSGEHLVEISGKSR